MRSRAYEPWSIDVTIAPQIPFRKGINSLKSPTPDSSMKDELKRMQSLINTA